METSMSKHAFVPCIPSITYSTNPIVKIQSKSHFQKKNTQYYQGKHLDFLGNVIMSPYGENVNKRMAIKRLKSPSKKYLLISRPDAFNALSETSRNIRIRTHICTAHFLILFSQLCA